MGRYGKVQSVSVSAWPAVELLWGHVGSVRVRAKSLALSPAQVASLLWEARGTASMDVSAESVRLGSLALSDASLIFIRREGASQYGAHSKDVEVRRRDSGSRQLHRFSRAG